MNCTGIAVRVVAAWILLAVAACGHEPVRRNEDKPGVRTVTTAGRVGHSASRSVGEQAAIVAVRQVGIPYRYGGDTTSGFDCSGLVHYAYAKAGKRIPRTTFQQWRSLEAVSADHLKIGDILFFRIDGKVAHVGMYLGNRRFVHAPASGREVTITSLDGAFYRRAFVRAGRPID